MEYGNGPTNELVWKTVHNRYHNEDFQVHEDNLNVNVALLSKYVQEGDTVLDIGCGEGKFGAVLKNKNCLIYGIDLDDNALEIALKKNNYKKGFVFNIEAPSSQDSDYCKFNAENIVFDDIALIDILEHVINPTQVIWNSVKYLKDGGSILVSVPNVNNADILLNLMRDRFNYRADGVLDNTHTKYFTKRSFAEWIKEINEYSNFTLDCEHIGSTYGYTDYLNTIKNSAPNVYQFVQMNPYFHVIQHLFLLKYYKKKDDKKVVDLNIILQEKEINLVEELEILLQGQLSPSSDQAKIIMLPNERKIMEDQILSANAGWAGCADELNRAKVRIEKSDAELLIANEFIQKQEQHIQGLKRATNGWKECAEALHDAKKQIKKLEAELTIANDFTQKQEQFIQELKTANKEIETKREECSTALHKANDGWRECAEALQRASVGWKECAEALREAKEQLAAKEVTS